MKCKEKLYKRGRLGLKQLEIGAFMESPIKPKKQYKQQWSAYNLAQTNEFTLFQDILIELIDSLVDVRKKLWKNGRPFMELRDMLFCCGVKCYFGKSARRNIGYLCLAKGKGYIQKVPHFNTIFNYFKNPAITPILKHLIEQSGLPVKEIENCFTTDSSGFSTSIYSRWFSVRIGENREKRLYKKAHVTSGVKSGIVTAVSITEGYWHDSPQFGELVKITAKNFNMREMSADAAYSSRENLDLVSSLGGIPYIAFRKNASMKPRGSYVWKRMLQLFQQHRQEFLDHYHLRSNAESVFSQIKRKFGTHLYSKSEAGQVNELLCLILAHNICVLIQELFESNTILDFRVCKKIRVDSYCASLS